LAFELLLKAVCFVHGTKTQGHKYRILFSALPLAARRRIRLLAGERMSTAADYSRLGALLDIFAKNFVNLRYPYERYEAYTERRFRRVGEKWVARGAPVARAHFRYRPSELHGLVFALVTEVRGWCLANPA
jgi:hypothetical protein